MCGIFGKLGPLKIEGDRLIRMQDSLVHRGPDDAGVYLNGPVLLGNRRLSIIDVEGGRQPISNEDGSVWVVCNGEIYNYRELRQSLIQSGHAFKTHGDTEVIVHLYEDFGEQCLEQLSGMFAFALWDEKKQKLFLARDRLGQKPLFFAENRGTLCFASEVKALLTLDEFPGEIDLESLHHYLSLRFVPAPRTMFHGIQKLPAAHYLIFDRDRIRIHRYWDITFENKREGSISEFLELLDEQLTGCVRSHLVSDVPVGAFLSGGMDSSMIVALIARCLAQPFRTFSIGVKEQDFNELPYARLVARRYQTQHIEEVVQSDLIHLLPRIVWHMEDPSDPIAACMYHAAALASRHVKVVLGGDGGDELFAGFDRYRGVQQLGLYTCIPAALRARIIGPLIRSVPDSFTYKSLSQRLRWMHDLSSLSSTGLRFATATTFFRFSHGEKRRLYCDHLWDGFKDHDSAELIAGEFEKSNANDPIDKMLYADFMTRLPEHSLALTDRMTMAHSLEARSPFLDHHLVEFSASLPSDLKIKGRQLKFILRELSRSYLPEEILRRPKQGFMFPIAYWFRNELHAFISQTLRQSFFVREGFFREGEILRLITEHKNNRVDHHVRLWMLLALEVWHQLFIEKVEIGSIQERLKACA